MFIDRINTACTQFPLNNKERFLVYPALAGFSLVENSVKTIAGLIFTALSLVSLGLYPSINNIANWTRYSRTVLTVPIQIIGNIFEIHSKILTRYNVREPEFDILLRGAQFVCINTFQTRSRSAIELLAKHILFRVSTVINALACLSLGVLVHPLISIVAIPFALYNRGQKAIYNNIALNILKIPKLIHAAGLSLRMIVNPLQFTKQASGEFKFDTRPYKNALFTPKIFWENMWEPQQT